VLVGSLTVNPKELNSNLGITRIEKVYDGNNSITGLNLDYIKSTALVLNADKVDIVGAGTFDSKNVGENKGVDISLALRGADAANYALSSSQFNDPVGVITQLNSVQWVGAAGGDWSNAANWAGGAIPDLDNVANIVIPVGMSTVYNSDQFGTTSALIANQGVIRFESANNFTFTNAVSGTGNIEQRGAGVLTIAGANTFTGVLDIGSGKVLLGHNNALGQGYVLSNGGSIGLTSGVILPSLRVDGAVTTTTAINTTGNQTYNGALTFASTGTATPKVAGTDPARIANFASLNGSIFFESTVDGGITAKQGQNSLVISALNGSVTFNDQVGLSALDPASPNLDIRTWNNFRALENKSPWAVDVLADKIFINANITTTETQYYSGAAFIGNNGRNGNTRLLLSLDPSITFDGTIDDTVNGGHNLVLRAISLQANEEPTIKHGDIGQTTPLMGFNAQVGQQWESGRVAEIVPDRFEYKGEITIGGSVKTTGDIIYKAGDVKVDAATPVTLRSDAGLISIETGLTPTGPKSMAIAAGQTFGVSVGRRGRFENSTGTPSGAFRFIQDPPPNQQSGGSLVAAVQRTLERAQSRQPNLEDYLDLTADAISGAEVSIGNLQDASNTPITGAEATGSGAAQIDCSEQTVAMANAEQCRSTNQD